MTSHTIPTQAALRESDGARALRLYLPPVLFLTPAALVLLLFMAVPMVNAILLSFQSWNGMSPPTWTGLNNYLKLFQDGVFLTALGHTAYFSVVTVLFQSTIPLLIASLLNAGVRGSTFFRTLYFMPVIISLAISGLLWAMIYEPNFGMLNTILRAVGLDAFTQLWLADRNVVMPSVILVSIWQSLGFYLVIYYAALQNIPRELYESAAIDGANAWHKLWHVTIPSSAPRHRADRGPQHHQRRQSVRPDLGDDRRRPEPRQRHARHLPLQHGVRRDGQLEPAIRLRDGDRDRDPGPQLDHEHHSNPPRAARARGMKG